MAARSVRACTDRPGGFQQNPSGIQTDPVRHVSPQLAIEGEAERDHYSDAVRSRVV